MTHSKKTSYDDISGNKENTGGQSDEDRLANSGLGILISSSLYKLEHISDHHVKERRHGFRMTNIFVGVVSSLIVLIALINLYNIYFFYNETMSIINTTHDLNKTVIKISANMEEITTHMFKINTSIGSMENVYSDVASMSEVMPMMQSHIGDVSKDVQYINQQMSGVSGNMNILDYHLKSMSGNVMNIEHNIHQLAEPMGKFNSILP